MTEAFQATVGLICYLDSHAPLDHGTLLIRESPDSPLGLKTGHWPDKDGRSAHAMNDRAGAPQSSAGDMKNSCYSHVDKAVAGAVVARRVLLEKVTSGSSGRIRCEYYQHSQSLPCKAGSTTHHVLLGKH